MALTRTSEERHVAVFTYPFTSHPFVIFNLMNNLAIAAPNVHFSFFNIPKSNKTLFSSNNPGAVPSNIRVYDLEHGCVPGGSDLLQEVNCFLRAVPGNFKRGVELAEEETAGLKITCFLTDAFFSSAIATMAEDRNVRWIGLWVPAPYALPAFLHLDYIQECFDNADQPEDIILDIIPGLSPICYLDLPCREVIEPIPFLSDSMEPSRSMFVSMVQNIHRASTIVSNSFQELSPVALTDHLKSEFKNLLFLGTLTLSAAESSISLVEDKTGCLDWLDRQKAKSVVYISFGTGIGCPPEDYSALAEALNAFGVPFLWILKDELKDHLPSGFLDRTEGKIVSWAPQSRILKHPSIGVYVTHCGYNSVLESVIGGVPMICRSIWTDNHMTGKMIEEVWEIGVRIEGGKFTKQGLIKCLETIFHHGKGKKMRENVNKLKQVLLKAAGPDGVAHQDFKTLVKIITS